MIRKALEYIVGLSEAKIEKINGLNYTYKPIELIRPPRVERIGISTLSSLVKYIQANKDELDLKKVLIVIHNECEVMLQSNLNEANDRSVYITVNAGCTGYSKTNKFIDSEEFNIWLQSSFIENNDRNAILKVVGNLKDEAVKQLNDDGISQKVTIKTGVASVGEAIVPNPVTLIPYSTFPEIEQPERLFTFRMRAGGYCALFESDASIWKNKAMNSIAEYLKKELTEIITQHDLTILH